jgi:tetratricopeptide (TPR) repeat protein
MRKTIFAAGLLFSLLAPLLLIAAPPGNWVEVRSPHFVIVSNADQSQALTTAVRFEQMRALMLNSVAGAKAGSEDRAPAVITVLAAEDEDSFKLLMPEFEFVPKVTNTGSLYISGYGLHQVALNLQAKGLNPYEGVYHDYFHLLIEPLQPKLPAWILEGLADFYGNTEIHEKTTNLGMPSHNFIDLLHKNTDLFPLDVLFAMDRNSPYYNERNRNTIFYAESWALVHYLESGDKGEHRTALQNYLSMLAQGVSEDEAVKALGDPTVLLLNLQRYIRKMPIPAEEVPPPARLGNDQFDVRALSAAEVDAYCGGFLTLHSQFKEAEPLLKEAVQLDPKLALAQRNLALLQYFQQQDKDGLVSANAAVTLDPQDTTARYLRADLDFESGSHDDPQIEADLRQALARNPDFAAADALLAVYLVAGNEKLDEALELGQKAVELEPEDSGFQLALAQVLLAMKRFDEAEAMGKRAEAGATDNGARAQVEQFLTFVADARTRAALGNVAQVNTSATAGVPAQEELLKRGDYTRPTVEGLVAGVVCTGQQEMDVTLKIGDDGAPLVFHSKDKTNVIYAIALPQQHAGINPCRELEGRTVRITFSAPQSKSSYGELVEIEITK